jgi:hypothetical protein
VTSGLIIFFSILVMGVPLGAYDKDNLGMAGAWILLALAVGGVALRGA